jgi:hypothetical protein
MSFVVFGLGALLALAGGLSIYDGYGIVQLERGWSEVIAGATALTGGIVTIALALILRRLQALCDLYRAFPRQFIAPDNAAVEPSMVPAIAVVAPPPLEQDDFGLKAEKPLQTFPQSAPAARPAARPLRDVPGVLRPAAHLAAPPSQPFYVPKPELEPLEETALAANEVAPPAAAHHPLTLEQTEPPQRPKPSTTALSLDEMWKRVTEEIERPILDQNGFGSNRSKTMNVIDSQHLEPDAGGTVEPAPVEPISIETVPIETATAEIAQPVHFDAPVEEPATQAAEPPVAEHEAVAEPVQEAALEAPATEAASIATELPLESEPEPEPPEAEHEPSYHMAPAVEPPIAEPAIIGRYEAEGTSYLMFADGSIEAQSAAGIFRFASMAELKAFIEDRQAVAP